MTNPEFITGPNGYDLAFHKTEGYGDKPGIVFLGGLKSDMNGSKALYLEDFCKEQGLSFLRLDYGGHGQSGGVFKDGSIKQWYADAKALFETQTSGSQIVIGSSMGGWISYLLARDCPARIQALISIAPAPDFTREVLAATTLEQKQELATKGYFETPSGYDEPYIWSRTLLEESDECCLLDQAHPYTGPVHILQGTDDAVVPKDKPERIEAMFSNAEDVTIEWLDGGDHSLSRPEDLAYLKSIVERHVI